MVHYAPSDRKLSEALSFYASKDQRSRETPLDGEATRPSLLPTPDLPPSGYREVVVETILPLRPLTVLTWEDAWLEASRVGDFLSGLKYP
jgi:hypothetical protein